VRCWTVALTCWGLAWAGGRGWLPTGTTSPEILLVPAATALALAAALGLVAFELDLPGYRFGWRQAASLAAAVAVVVGTTPVLVGSIDGRWHLSATDLADGLSWMPAQQAKGDFRVLWLGDPRALPLDGWRYRQGVAYAATFDGPPDATDLWPIPSPGVAHRLADDIRLAEQGRTTEVGHLLAPKAVRYVVLPSRAAATGANLPPPGSVLRALAAQNDLRAIDAVAGLTVYENVAWTPISTLRRHGPTHFTGRLSSGADAFVSVPRSTDWQLTVAGHRQPKHTAFGWASGFGVDGGGLATLRFIPSTLRPVLVVVELVLWVGLVLVIRRLRRRVRQS
jgi:hypothetical protein